LTDWESIARAHGPVAFETAWRVLGHVQDAEDAAQEALLDALRLHRDGGVDNWGGMLRRLATCRALDRLRQRKRRAQAPVGEDASAPAGDRPEHVAAARELAGRLRAALAELPERQATAFALRYFGEMSTREVADTLQVSDHAVAVALNKARDALARLLDVTDTRPRRAAGTIKPSTAREGSP
jgi:RNA polymerase sigma factor (sigma-70 family)